MILEDFFQSNSVSLEVMEMYDDLLSEKNKKVALNAVRRELYDEYRGEQELYIVFLMTLYYCGLKSNFIDEKSKKDLEILSTEYLNKVYGETEGAKISTLLNELLTMKPMKPLRKKIDTTNPGSKNWRVGDLYAYPLTGEHIRQVGLDGIYAIIYCLAKEDVSRQESDIIGYVLLCPKEKIQASLSIILEQSLWLPASVAQQYYQFKIISKHHEYPTESLLYLGNSTELKTPLHEVLPPAPYYRKLLLWDDMQEAIIRYYTDWQRHYQT